MADLETQRLQQQVDELTGKLNALGRSTGQQITAEEKAALKTRALGQAAEGAATGLALMTSQIYRGTQGAQVFTKAFKTATGAAGAAARSFERDIGRNSKVSRGLAALGVGLGELGDIVAGMSDQLFNSFQSLSRVGAAGAEGMAGVFDQLQNFRLGLEDLKQLTDLFGANAQSLVLFGGTVEQGAKSLGALRKFVTGSGMEQQFMALGMNTQEINESMVGFVAQQSRMGLRQSTDYAQVASSLQAYILEQDKITKLTGMDRKRQEEAAQKAMATEQFRAKIERLRAEDTEESTAEANRLMGIYKALAASGSGLEHAFAAAASGFITKGPGVTGQLVTQGEILKVVNNKNIQLAEGVGMIASGAEKFTSGVGRTLMSVGQFEQVTGAQAGALIDGIRVMKDISTNAISVEEAQKRQLAQQDPGVKAQIALRTAQMDTMQNFQSLVNFGVVPATNALAEFAEATRKTSAILPGGQEIGGGPRDSSIAEGARAGAMSADVLPGGTLPGGLGIQQRIIGGALGAATAAARGLMRQLGVGGQEINPDDVINFSQTGSGSRQHFDQLQPQVRERALAMAQAYQRNTGDKLNLTSAFRSAEEQAALIASGGQGNNPIAAPGQSLHQQGRALDFNPKQVDALENSGLLQQYGFKRGYPGGPHISMQDGGIAAGPKSGYQATLHGTEAVVPLPDGKTIPVTMPEMSNQMNMMSEQITRLDELIALMRNANGLSHKILQASTN